MAAAAIGGISTVSITCTIPLQAITLALITVALLTITLPPATRMLTVAPLAVLADLRLITCLAFTLPGTTWYSSTAFSIAGLFSRALSASEGTLAKAALVGANTV